MSTIYDGQNLARCFEVVSAAWKEIDALALLVNQKLEIHFHKNEIRYESMKRTWRNDETGWVGSDVAQCFGLIHPPKRKPSSFLGFQISVLGDGMAIAREPLVHFVHWTTPLDLNDDYVGFPEDEEPHYVDSDRLVRWQDGKNGNPPAWMFSIRLTTINSEGDVERIVQAMMNLLLGKPTNEALPSKFPGLVHYCMEGKSLKISG